MDHFYVTLPSDSSCYYFPANIIADFRTKLATPLELEHDKWDVGQVEISYPKWYKKRYLHNKLLLGSEDIIFPVKHYESVFDLLTNIPQFLEPSANANFIRIFRNYINKYECQSNDLFKLCRWENSIMVKENIVYYFPSRAYDSIDDLAETNMNPANCISSTVKHSLKGNINCPHPTPYTFNRYYQTKFSWRFLCATTNFPAFPIGQGLT